MTSAAQRLRALLTQPDPVVAPGAPDPLTALLAQEAGFAALHGTGGGIVRSLGQPDLGQFGLETLVARIGAITEACDLPIIVDVDSGFGGPLPLARAVRLLARVDAAAVHVEDREVPRRSLDPRADIMEPARMEGRIRAALHARGAEGPLVIARTDSRPALGLDAAIDRVNRYADAGADLVYLEFIKAREEIEAVARRVAAPKLIAVTRGETAPLTVREFGELGFRVVIFPADAQLAAMHAVRSILAHIRDHGTAEGFGAMATMTDRNRLVGTDAAQAFEQDHLPD
ncbi:isocitrate lyase/PEP mutase family protein [Falsiroseomonas sp. HW251]|uniref:isocitrate lyase/PEP mutase family protein n=1 Tax=Falsiroseomonas sp. HW251 TaxID=3390998 RepID=UPI003D31BBEA